MPTEGADRLVSMNGESSFPPTNGGEFGTAMVHTFRYLVMAMNLNLILKYEYYHFYVAIMRVYHRFHT